MRACQNPARDHHGQGSFCQGRLQKWKCLLIDIIYIYIYTYLFHQATSLQACSCAPWQEFEGHLNFVNQAVPYREDCRIRRNTSGSESKTEVCAVGKHAPEASASEMSSPYDALSSSTTADLQSGVRRFTSGCLQDQILSCSDDYTCRLWKIGVSA